MRAQASFSVDPSDGATNAERPTSFPRADFAERATGKGGAARFLAAGRRRVERDLVKAARIISLSVLASSSDGSSEIGDDVPTEVPDLPRDGVGELDGFSLANLLSLGEVRDFSPRGRLLEVDVGGRLVGGGLPRGAVEDARVTGCDPLAINSCSSSAAR